MLSILSICFNLRRTKRRILGLISRGESEQHSHLNPPGPQLYLSQVLGRSRSAVELFFMVFIITTEIPGCQILFLRNFDFSGKLSKSPFQNLITSNLNFLKSPALINLVCFVARFFFSEVRTLSAPVWMRINIY